MWFLIWCRRKMKIILAGIVLLAAAAYADVCVSPRLFAAGDLRVYAYNIDLDEITSETVFQRYYYDENNKQLRFDGIHNGSRYTIYQKYNEIMYSVDKNEFVDMTEGKLYYDEDNKQLRSDIQKGDIKSTVYTKYNEKKKYIVTGDNCISMDLQKPFVAISPPENANQVVTGTIGSQGESIGIITYAGKSENGASFLATYTAKDCMLTSSVSFQKEKNESFTHYYSVTDVDFDVNETLFELPSSCNDASSRLRRSV